MQCQCQEPSLKELFAEPVIQAMMARDAVAEADLRRLFARLRDRFDGAATPLRTPLTH